ncbi:MAG: AI-2E family transporter, partial [Candidatus Dormibacteraeota bacterium]|nr:AI-2E family transporter [Candidatus Dormibacteraeota bacterium]
MIVSAGPPRLQRALLAALVILAWTAVIIVIGWLLSHVSRALIILVLGALIAFALTPVVRLLQRWMPRALAIALAYLIGFVLVFGLLGIVIVSAAAEVASLTRQLPSDLHWAQALQPALLDLLRPFGVSADALARVEAQALQALQNYGQTAATDALGGLQSVVGGIVDAILVLILSIYLTTSGPQLGRWIRDRAVGRRRQATEVLGIIDQVVGGYVRGTFLMALLTGVAVGVGMWVLHVRYALLLGVLAFFMEFVPILGVMISGAVCIVVAAFNGWITAALVFAYFVVVHILEGDVVGPRIMGKAVGVHPAVAIVALVAGNELFGIWGALFGAPIAGRLQAFVV